MMATLVAQIAFFALPWSVRRWLLVKFLGFSVHPTARIGYSILLIDSLIMAEGARIGHFTIAKGARLVKLGPFASIGNGNWITGFPKSISSHFYDETDRDPCLLVGAHSAITNRHIIDCTSTISIGTHSTLAGWNSTLMTHSIDLRIPKQTSASITIGDFVFIGSNTVLLKGATVPSYSVVAACSCQSESFSETYSLYGGVPARKIKDLDPEMGYFQRKTGFVF